VKTVSVSIKSKSALESGKCSLESNSKSEVEEEPPGKTIISSNLEEEPPGKSATNRYRFFSHITDSSWND
jgi:hypothetical protein